MSDRRFGSKKTVFDLFKSYGGFVRYNRVNGNLALSRAFGDFEFKNYGMGFFSRQSPNPLQNPVIAKPTISIVPKNSEKDQLLLLGSDGIFDVFENSEDLAHYALNRFQVFFYSL